MPATLQDRAKTCMDQNDWEGAIPLWQQGLEQEPGKNFFPVSYTHLTPPTSDLM